MTSEADRQFRAHLRALLTQPQAHVTLDDVLNGFPIERINERVHGLPYSAFELLWHLRFTQRDILNFVRDADYHHVEWPDGYWPHRDGTVDAATFGVHGTENFGPAEIRGNLVKDLAPVNKVEMLP